MTGKLIDRLVAAEPEPLCIYANTGPQVFVGGVSLRSPASGTALYAASYAFAVIVRGPSATDALFQTAVNGAIVSVATMVVFA